jgi:hypothetical protein
MVRSFQYRIDGALPKLKVRVQQHAWRRLLKALLWISLWATLACVCARLVGTGVLPVIGLGIAILFSVIGIVIANYSVQWNTLWLTPDAVRLRIVRLVTRRTTSFPLATIRDFGFGICSHAGPVLRLDVGGRWFVLARDVREDEVGELLIKIRQHGYSFPDADTGTQNKSDPAPSFWTLG